VLRGGEQTGQFLNTGNIRKAGLKKGQSMPLSSISESRVPGQK